MPSEEIARHLARLEGADLVRLRAVAPDLEYWFRHTLVHETAYDTLLRHHRRQLHRVVGEALEHTYPDRLEELAPWLGHHFAEAGDARAVRYLMLAGDADARVYAYAEAVGHYGRALETAKGLEAEGASPGDPGLAQIHTRLGHALEMGGRFDEALQTYDEMSSAARERDDRELELASLVARGLLQSTPSTAYAPDQAMAASEKALALARELGDRASEARILWIFSLVHLFTDRPKRAVEYGEESLAIARELGLQEQQAYSLHNLSMARLVLGDTVRASAGLNEAGEMWHELGNQPMLAESMYLLAYSHYFKGDLDRSLQLSEQADRICQECHNLWGRSCSLAILGTTSLELGQVGQAVQALDQSVRFGEQAGFLPAQAGYRADLAWAYATLGMPEQGLELARAAVAQAKAQLPEYKPYTLATLARVWLLMGDLAQAEAAIREARVDFNPDSFHTAAPVVLALAEGELLLSQGKPAQATQVADELLARLIQLGMTVFVPDVLYLKGLALMGLGTESIEGAAEAFYRARDIAQAMKSHRASWRILNSLGEMELRRGDVAAGESLKAQARRLIDEMAGQAGAPDLQAAVLRLGLADPALAVRARGRDDAG